MAPTTSVPSTMPSMTGLVATFEVTKTVTTSLSEEEIAAIEEEVMSNFNVTDKRRYHNWYYISFLSLYDVKKVGLIWSCTLMFHFDEKPDQKDKQSIT